MNSFITSTMPNSAFAASYFEDDVDEDTLTSNGAYYPHPANSCYGYYQSGYNGYLPQDHGYLHVDGSNAVAQSEDASALYCPPEYNQCNSGAFMGVDGQCHQPYYSSSGYIQPPLSYPPEALSCYPWGHLFLGVSPFGTTASSEEDNLFSRCNVSSEIAGLNSTGFYNNGAGKSSTSSFVDSKSIQKMADLNNDKPCWNYHSKPLNKVSYSSYVPQSVSISKWREPREEKSAFRYQKQENFNRYNGPVIPIELVCGPRAQKTTTTTSNHSDEKEEDSELKFQKEQCNKQDFCIKYESAKFYVIKSYSEEDIHKSVKYHVWASTVYGNEKLDAAFHEADAKFAEKGTKCPIFLFFSVNGSGKFVGMAEMVGPIDFDKDMDFWDPDHKWNGFFPVEWHIIKDIPSSELRHILLENNDFLPVTRSRDTQEILMKPGLEMLHIFKNYVSGGMIFDDFAFYESREKSLRSKKLSSNSPSPDSFLPEEHTPDVFLRPAKEEVKVAGTTKEGASRGERRVAADGVSSLTAMTNSLSLGPAPQRRGGYTPRSWSVKNSTRPSP